MDTSSFGFSGHPVMAAVDAVSDTLDKTVDADVWALSDDDLAETLVRLDGLAARQAELSLRLVREADARDLGRRQGAPSTAAWLRHRLRLRPGEAKTRVDLANRLTHPAAGEGPTEWAASVGGSTGGRSMPATAAALAAGTVSVEHATVIAKTMAALPISLSAEQCQVAERQLAGWAGEYDPVQLANLGRSLIHLLDTDTLHEREQRAHQRRELRLVDHGDGSTRIAGQLDTESAAIVRAALDPLAVPFPSSDGEADPRTAGQRMADALVELARRALNHGDLPARHAVRPHLAITAGLDTLLAKAADRGVPPGEVGWGGPISTASLRRLACDAGITRVLTDPASVPLDVGREQRTVTAGQWAALVVRDGGCAFPGCQRPPEWCIAHHIRHWADGGPTDLDNLVLLCGYHHRVVHHHGWEVQLGADRHPEFLPPPWITPDRQPRRNSRPQYHERAGPTP